MTQISNFDDLDDVLEVKMNYQNRLRNHAYRIHIPRNAVQRSRNHFSVSPIPKYRLGGIRFFSRSATFDLFVFEIEQKCKKTTVSQGHELCRVKMSRHSAQWLLSYRPQWEK